MKDHRLLFVIVAILLTTKIVTMTGSGVGLVALGAQVLNSAPQKKSVSAPIPASGKVSISEVAVEGVTVNPPVLIRGKVAPLQVLKLDASLSGEDVQVSLLPLQLKHVGSGSIGGKGLADCFLSSGENGATPSRKIDPIGSGFNSFFFSPKLLIPKGTSLQLQLQCKVPLGGTGSYSWSVAGPSNKNGLRIEGVSSKAPADVSFVATSGVAHDVLEASRVSFDLVPVPPGADTVQANMANQLIGTYSATVKNQVLVVERHQFSLLITGKKPFSADSEITDVMILDDSGTIVAGPAPVSGKKVIFPDPIKYPVGFHTYSIVARLGAGVPVGTKIGLSTRPSSDWSRAFGQIDLNSVGLSPRQFTLAPVTVMATDVTNRTQLTFAVVALDGISVSDTTRTLGYVKEFIEKFSPFAVKTNVISDGSSHGFTSWTCDADPAGCVTLGDADLSGETHATLGALTDTDGLGFFYKVGARLPLQAGSTYGPLYGIQTGAGKLGYFSIPADVWYFSDESYQGFATRKAQIATHEAINVIQATLADNYNCPVTYENGNPEAYAWERGRLELVVSTCADKLQEAFTAK